MLVSFAFGLRRGESMPKAVCPSCGKNIQVDSDEAALYETVTCPYCDAKLEVIDDDPLMLEEITDY
jgi:lysine biosynthesis protein LysW